MRLAASGSYGRGIYFAGDASYSAGGYFHTNAAGNRVLILAKVLVGNYTEGSSGSHITCPPLLPGSKTERYDSIKAAGSDIFIVYNNNKAYPSYIIEYQHNNSSFNPGMPGIGMPVFGFGAPGPLLNPNPFRNSPAVNGLSNSAINTYMDDFSGDDSEDEI